MSIFSPTISVVTTASRLNEKDETYQMRATRGAEQKIVTQTPVWKGCAYLAARVGAKVHRLSY